MPKTVIGLFDNYEKSQDVMQDLVDSGIEPDGISTITKADANGPITTTEHGAGAMSAPMDHPARALVELGMPTNKARYYAEAVQRGGTLVVVSGVDDKQLENAVKIIDAHGSVDINNRALEWRQTGWDDGEPDADDAVVVVETTYIISAEDRRRAS